MGFIAAANWTEYEIEGADQPQLCTVSPLTHYPNSHPQFPCPPYTSWASGGFHQEPLCPLLLKPLLTIFSDLIWASVRPIWLPSYRNLSTFFDFWLHTSFFCAVVGYCFELFLHSFTIISLRLWKELEIHVGVKATILLQSLLHILVKGKTAR